jgi:hypothetical protein
LSETKGKEVVVEATPSMFNLDIVVGESVVET